MSELIVVVLTLNEDSELKPLVENLRQVVPGAQRWLIDCGSTDETVAVGRSLGFEVLETDGWPGFAAQRNWALSQTAPTGCWTLFLDADERLDPSFREWWSDFRDDGRTDIYWLPSSIFFLGKLLRRAPGYPILHPRLFRPGLVNSFRVAASGHGEDVVPTLRSAEAAGSYTHTLCASGELQEWLAKHVRLAAAEVEALGAGVEAMTARRRLLERTPRSVRPVARFVYHYLLRAGFLDGKQGFIYSSCYAWFEATQLILASDRR